MRLRNRILFLVLAAVAMLGWAGCGGGCPAGTAQHWLRFRWNRWRELGKGTTCGPGTNPGGGGNGSTAALLYYIGTSNILGASLSTTGTFAPLTAFTPPTLPSSVGNDMVIVNKKFLYLPQSDSLTIQAFTIDHSAGALTAIAGSPFATAGADSVVAIPPVASCLWAIEIRDRFPFFRSTPPPGRWLRLQALRSLLSISTLRSVLAVDGTGNFLYVGQDLPALPIYGFSIDQNTGALSPAVGSPFNLDVAGVRTDFPGKFAVGITGNTGDNHLYVFAIDPTTGALAAVNNSPFPTVASTPLQPRDSSQQPIRL